MSKGQFELSGEQIKWFFYMFLLIIILIFYVYFASVFVFKKIDTYNSEQYILVNNLAINCFSPKGEINIIDVKLFNKENAERCFLLSNVAYKMKLDYFDKNIELGVIGDNELFVKGKNDCKNYGCGNYNLLVFVNDDNKVYEGVLNVEMVSV